VRLNLASMSLQSSGTVRNRLEWARDRDFRFFPAVAMNCLVMIHTADIATNKGTPRGGGVNRVTCSTYCISTDGTWPLGSVDLGGVRQGSRIFAGNSYLRIRATRRYRADDYAVCRRRTVYAGTWRGDCARRSMKLRCLLARCLPHVVSLFLLDGKPVQPEPQKVCRLR